MLGVTASLGSYEGFALFIWRFTAVRIRHYASHCALRPTILQIKVEGVHPVVYDEYINIYYRQNTTIKLSNDYH
jgi:hypothetical protein